jgi:hypothetical protein
MLTIISTAIAGACTAVALLTLAALQIHARRDRRRRVRSARRLEDVVNEHWYPAARSFESPGTARAFQLRSLGQATLEIAKELAQLDNGTGLVPEWSGPPFKPVALERADRPGPPDLWHRFDQAFEAFWLLRHPLDDGLELAHATMALADWNEQNQPGTETTEPPQPDVAEQPGAAAAFLHAVSAPCLANLSAENTIRQGMKLLLDREVLAAQVDEDGDDTQRTMLALARALGPAKDGSGPTIGELLALENTDLCHALEAVALARSLRRVYPAQRPDLLWMHAALAESVGEED